MTQMGMDVDAVEQRSRELASRGEQLNRTIQRIDRDVAILSAQWQGADRQALTRTAWPQRRAELSRLQQALTDASAALNRQASEQRRVSAARGSGHSGTTSGFKSPSPPAQREGSPWKTNDPTKVKEWWAGLSEKERQAFSEQDLKYIGGKDGLPAVVRDGANQILLDRDIKDLETRAQHGGLNKADQRALTNALKTREALNSVKEAETFLLVYDPRAYGGDGTVAISVGNPDTADNVTSYIPGLDAQMDTTGDGVSRALNLYKAAGQVAPGSQNAVIYALVYDTPSNIGTAPDGNAVLSTGRAKEGSEIVANFVNGLKTSRGNDQPHMSVIGHSYGSTTVSYAFTEHGLKTDDVILIGSPGTGDAKTAADFGEAKVWVGSASRDSVTHNGSTWHGLGEDPANHSYKANRFDAESYDRGAKNNLDDHSRYFQEGSESVKNMAHILTGQDSDVDKAVGRGAKGDKDWDPEQFRNPRPNTTKPDPSALPNTNSTIA